MHVTEFNFPGPVVKLSLCSHGDHAAAVTAKTDVPKDAWKYEPNITSKRHCYNKNQLDPQSVSCIFSRSSGQVATSSPHKIMPLPLLPRPACLCMHGRERQMRNTCGASTRYISLQETVTNCEQKMHGSILACLQSDVFSKYLALSEKQAFQDFFPDRCISESACLRKTVKIKNRPFISIQWQQLSTCLIDNKPIYYITFFDRQHFYS